MKLEKLKSHTTPIVLFLLMLLTYFPTFVWMWGRWFARDSYYSHGILIPAVSLALIWVRRDELRKIRPSPSGWGLFLIIFGLLLHAASSLPKVFFSSGFSILFTLFGIVLYCYGTEICKKIAFPLAFVFFMIPMPEIIVVNLSFKMKLFAAQIATNLLNGMGILALREGSTIMMRHAHVVVDDVCSGLRSLISLMALGCLFAYWLKGPVYKKIILFLTTIPIAIITNVCRVVVLSTISEIWGPQYATGLIHDATGYMVFVLAFIMLYAAGRVIE